MTLRRPSRVAFAILHRLLSNDEFLKGDLLEEFEKGRSQRWLWRQVIGAVVCRSDPRPSIASLGKCGVGIALLLLLSFEAILVTDLVLRLVFGPPVQNISGYLYLFHRPEAWIPHERENAQPSMIWAVACVLVLGLSLPIGYLIARIHEHHRVLAVTGFAASMLLCVAITTQAAFVIQFLTVVGYVIGLLVGARAAVVRATP